ncbi:hypothetical protein KR009_004420 [Drosophila setifemur]|nr:hypothetical protein KR009_004420 [Drosophila setifemur]
MNLIFIYRIPFSSLLVILGCLAWTCTAQNDFNARAYRMARFFADNSISEERKMAHFDELKDFYERYRSSIRLTAGQRAQADAYLLRYKQLNTPGVLVDGVPAQGGIAKRIIKKAAVELARATAETALTVGATAAMDHLSSSASSFGNTFNVAIFGIPILISIYFFSSKRV